jgi:hypothetical protein
MFDCIESIIPTPANQKVVMSRESFTFAACNAPQKRSIFNRVARSKRCVSVKIRSLFLSARKQSGPVRSAVKNARDEVEFKEARAFSLWVRATRSVHGADFWPIARDWQTQLLRLTLIIYSRNNIIRPLILLPSRAINGEKLCPTHTYEYRQQGVLFLSALLSATGCFREQRENIFRAVGWHLGCNTWEQLLHGENYSTFLHFWTFLGEIFWSLAGTFSAW